jgi:hypothetical protein
MTEDIRAIPLPESDLEAVASVLMADAGHRGHAYRIEAAGAEIVCVTCVTVVWRREDITP